MYVRELLVHACARASGPDIKRSQVLVRDLASAIPRARETVASARGQVLSCL